MAGSSPPFRVALVDSSELFRLGCKALFESDSRFLVVADGDLGYGREFLDCDADLLIVDPAVAGIVDPTVVPRLLEKFPAASLILLTDACAVSYLHHAMRLGVRGLISKSQSTGPVLLNAAHLVATRAVSVFDSNFLTLLTEGSRITVEGMDPARSLLTPREIEILQLLASGTSDGEIAHLLGLAATTVQTHVGNILRKAGVTTRVQLGVFAVATQIVEWPEESTSLAAI